MSETSSPQQPNGESNKRNSYSVCGEDVDEDLRPTADGVEIDAFTENGEPIATFTVIPPDGGWGWVIVAASFFCNLVVDGIIFAFGMFLGDISAAFNESKANVSIIGSLLAGFYLMVGVGFGLVYVPAVIAVGFYFEKWRALATGIAVCGSGIGTFLMAPLCTVLIEEFGWRGALLIQAGLVLNCAVFGMLFRPLKPINVTVDQNLEIVCADDRKKSSAEQLPLLLRIKMARDDQMRNCESLASFADNTSLTAESKPGPRNRFFKTSNNNMYPTAAEVLTRSTTALESSRRMSSHSLDLQTNALYGSNVSDASPPKSNKRLSAASYSDAVQQEEDGKAGLVVTPISEDVTIKKVATFTELLKPVQEETHGSDENTEMLGTGARSAVIQAANKAGKRTRTTSDCSSRSRDVGIRPFYRDDIFFSASLHRLPQYTSQISSLGYHMSVTRLPTKKDVQEEVSNGCKLCPEAVSRTFSTMLDMSLLKSPTFLLLSLSGFITMMGFYVPFMYITDRAEVSGMEPVMAIWLVSTIGITNTIGRVACGVVSSLPGVDALFINNVALTVGGVATILSGISLSFSYQIFYSSVFGLSMACFASLRSILIVDLMGLDKLTNAFGLLLLFQGIAAVIGSPLAGSFMDATGSYDASFYLSGSLILVSAILCYPLNRVNRWEIQKSESRTPAVV